MKTELEIRPGEDEGLLDLLVDGELDDARRRDLLLKLESAPGGWRNCALAFLEAQSWRQELGAISRDTVPAPPMVKVERTPRFLTSVWGSALAIAASFAIAFGLGSWYRGGEAMKSTASNQSVTAQSNPPVPTPSAPVDAALGELIDQDGYMTLALGGVADGELQQVRVPVAQEGFDAATLERPVELPRDLLAELQRNGQTVLQQRSYLPVQLQDGRSIIVPMDELQIVPVNRTFQ